MKKILLFLILIINVFADEILVDTFSYHITDIKLNNKNYGIGYKKEFNDDYSLLVGYFYNSYDKNSFYLGIEKMFEVNENFNAGISGGVTTGYPFDFYTNNKWGILPMLFGEVEYKITSQIKSVLLVSDTHFLPMENDKTTLFHLQFRFDF